MDKLKNFFKITATNKMMWITLIIGVTIIITTTVTACGIKYIKSKSELANANTQEPEGSTIKQEELVDTSKLSEEELKKLNEEEVKKAKEKEEEENKKKGNTTSTKPVKNKYYIKINYGAQVVTIYTYDKNGKYTVPVRACVCSTGAATPTSGVYRLSWKATWGKLFGNVWGQYCSQVVGDILIHSVPYKQNRKDTLVSTYYDRLGTKDSMGCIRLTTIDAQWIYYNCPSGTQVEFYSSSNPGPLGKPTAKKVSNAPGKLKNWDPTDPDPRNPWRKYKPEENNKNNNTNSNTQTPSGGNNTNTQIPPTENNENQGGTTTPPTGNNENQGGTTTSPTGNNENQGGTTTPPTENNENQGGTTTPPTGNNENQGETTTPPTGNNENQGGTTTPPTGDSENQGGTTDPSTGDDKNPTTPENGEGRSSENNGNSNDEANEKSK